MWTCRSGIRVDIPGCKSVQTFAVPHVPHVHVATNGSAAVLAAASILQKLQPCVRLHCTSYRSRQYSTRTPVFSSVVMRIGSATIWEPITTIWAKHRSTWHVHALPRVCIGFESVVHGEDEIHGEDEVGCRDGPRRRRLQALGPRRLCFLVNSVARMSEQRESTACGWLIYLFMHQ